MSCMVRMTRKTERMTVEFQPFKVSYFLLVLVFSVFYAFISLFDCRRDIKGTHTNIYIYIYISCVKMAFSFFNRSR